MSGIQYIDVFTFDNLLKSAKKCTEGVLWKPSVQMFTIYRLQWCASLYKELNDRAYKSMGFCKFWLRERGKTRFIQSVHISERCVQKTLNNYCLRPLIDPRLIYDNSASRVGMGTEFAIKRLRKDLARHYRKYRRSGGILTLDLHDYFNSIPHDKLLPMLRKVISDDDIYNLSKYFIDCFGDKGLGLGSEISQICAIYYLNDLDHYIKEQLHIESYGRYMDDLRIIHHDIEYLRRVQKIIKNRLETYYEIQINPKSTITRFDKGSFVYLKRRFSITKTGKILTRLLRKNTTKRRRILKRQKKQCDKGRANISSIRQSYQSWRGYASKWNNSESVRNMDSIYKQLFEKEECDEKRNRTSNGESHSGCEQKAPSCKKSAKRYRRYERG